MQVIEELGKVISGLVGSLVENVRKEHRHYLDFKTRPESRIETVLASGYVSSLDGALRQYDYSSVYDQLIEDVTQTLVTIRTVVEQINERCDLHKTYRGIKIEEFRLEKESGDEITLKGPKKPVKLEALTNLEPDFPIAVRSISSNQFNKPSPDQALASSSKKDQSCVSTCTPSGSSVRARVAPPTTAVDILLDPRDPSYGYNRLSVPRVLASVKSQNDEVYFDHEIYDPSEDARTSPSFSSFNMSTNNLCKRELAMDRQSAPRMMMPSSSRRTESTNQNKQPARDPSRLGMPASINSRLNSNSQNKFNHPHMKNRPQQSTRSPKKFPDKKKLEELQAYAQVLQQRIQRDCSSKSKERNYVRGRYKMYTTEEKKKILEFAWDLGRQEVSRALGIPSKKILQFERTGPERRKGAGRKQTCPNLERMLLEWLEEKIRVDKAFPPTNICLHEALSMAANVGREKMFKASKGWFAKFKTRNEKAINQMIREAQGGLPGRDSDGHFGQDLCGTDDGHDDLDHLSDESSDSQCDSDQLGLPFLDGGISKIEQED